MKFVIPPALADAFRRDDGTLPPNVEVWDGYTRASDGEERTWLTDSATYRLDRLPTIKQPFLAEHPAPATFKGKRVAQWKLERRSRGA